MKFIFLVLAFPSVAIALIYWGDLLSFAVKRFKSNITYLQYLQEYDKYPEKQYAKLALFAIPAIIVYFTLSICSFIPNGDYSIVVTANLLPDLSLYASADIYIEDQVYVNTISFENGKNLECDQSVDVSGGTVTIYGNDDSEIEVVVPEITQAVLGITPQYIVENNKLMLAEYGFLIISNILYILHYINHHEK